MRVTEGEFEVTEDSEQGIIGRLALIAQRIEQTRPKGKMGVQFLLGAPKVTLGSGRIDLAEKADLGWVWW